MTISGKRKGKGWRLVSLFAAVSLIFVGPACWLLARQVIGTHATAEVIGCSYRSVGRNIEETCTAAWTVHGQRVVGELEGASGYETPGQHVDVTIHGHTATSHSIGLPLVLLGLGAVFAVPLFPLTRGALGRLEANRRKVAME
ncbi:hypothetical protein [Nocardioides ultimimeridianus]